MAAYAYHASTPFATSQGQDLHQLLPPTMTSSRFSFDKSSQLMPLQCPPHSQALAYSDYEHLKQAETEDRHLKTRIRKLRVISRTLALLISIAVLIPTALTLHKFLSTRSIYRPVTLPSGQSISRTPWAHNTRAWPTYMYFGVAAASVLFDCATIFSYKFGVGRANVASVVTTTFSWVNILGNLIIWCVAVGMYRAEKDKDGKSNDLWGWTCSAGARAIQKEFVGDVDFGRYCNVQSVSWYIGIVQASAALLTVLIYVLVYLRRGTKKEVEQRLRMSGYERGRQ
ncbi:hypothetical protein G6011_11158 [Alternaria panax]|uniref:MARVEL domain-containing protein n=1 Tax=Alternaria panax TaxID=48097 RepID=A0AAD4IDA3_9PLEO|nr:hypothetical protein G6011_11158 [Alternaria panax]